MALDQKTHGYPSKSSKPLWQTLFFVVCKSASPLSEHPLPPNTRRALVCVLLLKLAQNSQIDGSVVALISRAQALIDLTEVTIK